eukprot:scaffold1821_cov344-Pavlova_lutheri.AAC.7
MAGRFLVGAFDSFAFLPIPDPVLDCVQRTIDSFPGECHELGEAGPVLSVVEFSGGQAPGELGPDFVPFFRFSGVFSGHGFPDSLLVCVESIAFCPGHGGGFRFLVVAWFPM